MRILKFIICLTITFSTNSFSSPIESSKLFTYPEAFDFKISPDGGLISAIKQDDKKRELLFIDTESNLIEMVLNIGLDVRLLSYHWLNDEQLILLAQYESTRMYLVATISGKKVKLKASKASGYLIDVLSHEPDKILFARNTRGQYYRIYVVSIEEFIDNSFSDATEVLHNGENISRFSFDQRSQRIITQTYDKETKVLSIKSLPISGGKWRLLLEKNVEDIEFSLAAILSSEYVTVLTNQETDKVALQKYNIKKQKLEEVIYEHPKYDLKEASYNREGKLLSVVYEELGLMRREYFNPVGKQMGKQLSQLFPGKEYFLVDYSKDFSKSVLKVQGATLPGDYFTFDAKRAQLRPLLLAYPQLENEKLYSSKAFTVMTSDKDEVEAFLTLADNELDHKTLLVMPHGGPIGIKESDRYNSQVQYFVSRGFSVLRVNFRGSRGFGKKFKNRGVGEFGKLIERDISTVVEQVISKYKFDKMCSVGASYGGYSSVMLAIKHPEKYDCVVGAMGIYDLLLAFNHNNYVAQEKNRKPIENVIGKYDPNLKDTSPVYLASKLKAPILLIAGIEDQTAVFEHTHRLEYMLKKNKKPVETMYYENTGHGHYSWSGDRHEAAITYDFLMRTLNLTEPSPKSLSASARKAIATDYAIIADKFWFEDNVENDKDKSLEFYRKAAEYEEPRAMFNVGAFYHSGDQVTKDISKAITYYRKAANLDYAKAHSRLGRMYMEGEHLDVNWEKAKEHLEKALNLDDTPENYFRLARFDCTAPGKMRNIKRCLASMNLDRFERRSKRQFNRAINGLRSATPWILSETKFNEVQREKFDKILNMAFELNEMDVSIDSKRVGAFEFIEGVGYGVKDEYKTISNGPLVKHSEKDNYYYGMIFEVDIPGINSYRDKVGIAARWTQNMKDGTKKYPNATVLYGAPKGEWKLIRKFDDFEGGNSVTLELFDLKGKPIFKETFIIKS
ncbi:prolyl oligopeptidase family serine peptidase [Aliikangiella sp. G2MR2-5]|uniref:prolyl oligopeptidase family serine peptidase n=1 Tax=Aliikangiella sp. G2MR2-5 TaxID=2788943 RepID=UPI0018AA99B7|nr:prolyl oligopeptidase family serine peptidase [Aliikangiella sp. G2MR2-5]